jgi:DNA invertase Pin-like site-specific DNA recombinase
LGAYGINLHILSGSCAGMHRPDGTTVTDDILAIARACRERGESVTVIARHLGVGRSTLYRALNLEHERRSAARAVSG